MGNIVSFHTGCNFDGQSSGSLNVGDYDIGQMRVPNDSIKSIKITPGFKVTVYEHAGFQGGSFDLTGDVKLCGWPLGLIKFPGTNTPITSNTSSFRIRKINGFENVDEPSSDSETSIENFTDFSNSYYILILAIVLLIAFLNRERLMKMIKA